MYLFTLTVIQSEAKDLGSIKCVLPGFFGRSPQQLVFTTLRSVLNDTTERKWFFILMPT